MEGENSAEVDELDELTNNEEIDDIEEEKNKNVVKKSNNKNFFAGGKVSLKTNEQLDKEFKKIKDAVKRKNNKYTANLGDIFKRQKYFEEKKQDKLKKKYNYIADEKKKVKQEKYDDNKFNEFLQRQEDFQNKKRNKLKDKYNYIADEKKKIKPDNKKKVNDEKKKEPVLSDAEQYVKYIIGQQNKKQEKYDDNKFNEFLQRQEDYQEKKKQHLEKIGEDMYNPQVKAENKKAINGKIVEKHKKYVEKKKIINERYNKIVGNKENKIRNLDLYDIKQQINKDVFNRDGKEYLKLLQDKLNEKQGLDQLYTQLKEQQKEKEKNDGKKKNNPYINIESKLLKYNKVENDSFYNMASDILKNDQTKVRLLAKYLKDQDVIKKDIEKCREEIKKYKDNINEHKNYYYKDNIGEYNVNRLPILETQLEEIKGKIAKIQHKDIKMDRPTYKDINKKQFKQK